MVPVFGEVFDLADAGISYLRGDYLGASLSMAAMIPGIGNVAGAGKFANRLNKVTKSAVKKYEVGTFDTLTKRSVKGDKLDIHHVTQKHPAAQVIDGYDPKTAPSMAVPNREHRRIPTIKGKYNGTARDLLAKDVKDLRNKTNAPNSAIKKLIDLNKQTYPDAFKK